ncbi:uncharacterized protein TNCV_2355161 [Trichonephila clavipes]|nr:uncharacterized protein TNCV_2355161 [Trichonephila clavipes]
MSVCGIWQRGLFRLSRQEEEDEREIPNKKDASAYLGEEMPNILAAGKKWSPSFTDDSCGVTVGRHDGCPPSGPFPFRPFRTYSSPLSRHEHIPLFGWRTRSVSIQKDASIDGFSEKEFFVF